MRKRIFLTLVLSLCMADFGAFAATRGSSSSSTGKTVMAARAGRTQKVVAQPNVATPMGVADKTNTASADGNLKKRAATNTTKKVAGPVMAARAGKTQKVVSNGTKVSEAVTNTAVPQECQNWFFGCMDSFCMVDNVNGARCQCSDRNAELQTAMEEIAKMDEQSYILATQGVERIKMGEKADAIIAAAKAASNKVTGKATDTTIGTSIKSKGSSIGGYQLDLSSLKSNIFAEEDDDDAFEVLSPTVDTSVINNALAKKGNELYTYSAKMCLTSNMPDTCKSHTQILQNMYVQKIRSDCAAFENKLKQDKIASSEKLRTAEAALRSAALESYEDKNKYNLGGCVQEYAKCMQNECGSDYSKCMLLAAEENMKGGAGDAKARTIKGVVDIVLSGSTMTQLLAKKTICDDEVLVHCENVRAQVWDRYIEGAATEIHAAELTAEDNKRQNCIKTTAECFKNSCAASWDPNSDAANYDICLSDPYMVYQNCKIQVEACIVATGGRANIKQESDLDGSTLWTGVKSMLAALRVDACTKELKKQIENICGSDFAHCVGLNPGSIAELVPTDTLTACKDKNQKDPNAVYQYIYEIAQGYALQINDELYAVCDNAAKSAMLSVCGDAETCDSLKIDDIDFASLLKVQFCIGDSDCKDSLEGTSGFTDDQISSGNVMARIRDRLNPRAFKYEAETTGAGENRVTVKNFKYTDTSGSDYISKDDGRVKAILEGLNGVLGRKLATMKSNKTVKECMEGKDVTGFKNVEKGEDGDVTKTQHRIKDAANDTKDTIYTNLLDNYTDIMVDKALSLVQEQYYQAEKDLQPKLDAATDKISAKITALAKAEEERIDQINANECALKALASNLGSNGNECDCDDDLVKYNLPYPNVAKAPSATHSSSGRCSGYKADPNNAAQGMICGCFEKDGYCEPSQTNFFDTWGGRNYKRQKKGIQFVQHKYNAETNECTLTTVEYKCARGDCCHYCYEWNKTPSQVGSPDVIKMPTTQPKQ